jgi:hypothetical protein
MLQEAVKIQSRLHPVNIHSSFFVVCLSVVDCGSPSSHVSPSSSPSDVPTVGPTGRFVSNSTRTSSTEQ